MKYVIAAASIAFSVTVSDGAWAQTLTECGKSDGYTYFKGGWKKDSIDDGRIILNFIDGEADLLVKNATGSTISVKQDGGRIYARKTTNGLIALTVFYDDTAITEDYVFQLDDRGDGMVTSTVIRTASKLNKMSLMTAECRAPR